MNAFCRAILDGGKLANEDGETRYVTWHPAYGWTANRITLGMSHGYVECPPGLTCTVVYHDGERRVKQYPLEEP